MVLAITVPGTYSLVVAIRTAAVLAIVVSEVVPKIKFSPGGGTVLMRILLLGGSSMVIGIRFRVGDQWNSELLTHKLSPPEYSSLYGSFSVLFSMRLALAYNSSSNNSM